MPVINNRGNHGGPKVEIHQISGGSATNNYVPTSQGDGTLAFEAGGGGGGTPGGSNTQIQYNNAGAFGGITGATTNGTALTLVAPVLGTPASGTLTNCTGLLMSGMIGTAPIEPCIIQPDTSGQIGENVHYDGTAAFTGIGVVGSATLSADRTVQLYFQLPMVLPAGQCKLMIISVGAIAGSHAYKFNPKIACIATTERVAKTRTAEGTTTVNVTTSEADDFVVTKINMDAVTIVAGNTLAVDFVFEDSGWTVTVVSTHRFFIIFE